MLAELGGSVSDFDQLRAYVEQIASILANLAKEVGAHALAGVERRLDEVGRVTVEIETLRQETREIAAIVGELVQRRANAPVPWWPDLPAGPEREAAVQNLGLWVDEVLRARHPEAYNEQDAQRPVDVTLVRQDRPCRLDLDSERPERVRQKT